VKKEDGKNKEKVRKTKNKLLENTKNNMFLTFLLFEMI